jgi:hypothetical protein
VEALDDGLPEHAHAEVVGAVDPGGHVDVVEGLRAATQRMARQYESALGRARVLV